MGRSVDGLNRNPGVRGDPSSGEDSTKWELS